jgi:hypothetical protein
VTNLVLTGEYSDRDSIQVTAAYLNAKKAVYRMHDAMNVIWAVDPQVGGSKKLLRKEKWEAEEAFITWLGDADKIRMVRRKIKRIHSKFDKKFVLDISQVNDGRCKRWISAWTIPFGSVKIRLCVNYLKYRTHLQEKTLVHELGHEAGMLYHKRIHDCWRAQRAAESVKNNVAKRSPENYAWLAMSYIGQQCAH